MEWIDLNCDMGEGMLDDEALMPLISSANIACGYHAGSAALMARTVELALRHGVAVGAHPGFDDRDHFGRTEIHLLRRLVVCAGANTDTPAAGYMCASGRLPAARQAARGAVQYGGPGCRPGGSPGAGDR